MTCDCDKPKERRRRCADCRSTNCRSALAPLPPFLPRKAPTGPDSRTPDTPLQPSSPEGAGAPEGDAPLGALLVSARAPLPPLPLPSRLLSLLWRFCSPVPLWVVSRVPLRRCGRRFNGWSVIALGAQRVWRGGKEERWEKSSSCGAGASRAL